MDYQFDKKTFVKGNTLANKIEYGVHVVLHPKGYCCADLGILFYVDDVDKEYRKPNYSTFYTDDQEVMPEHSFVTLYNESDDSIFKIPGDAMIQVVELVE